MKDPQEVLRMKEQEILRVRQEIEALRITAKLLGEESSSASEGKIEFRRAIKMP
jgi:hypothetical protein